MKRSWRKVSIATLGIISLVAFVACHKKSGLTHPPTLVKYPSGKQPSREKESSPLESREDYYIRPRAYPSQVIDENLRLRAFQQLKVMRERLGQRHLNPG